MKALTWAGVSVVVLAWFAWSRRRGWSVAKEFIYWKAAFLLVLGAILEVYGLVTHDGADLALGGVGLVTGAAAYAWGRRTS